MNICCFENTSINGGETLGPTIRVTKTGLQKRDKKNNCASVLLSLKISVYKKWGCKH